LFQRQVSEMIWRASSDLDFQSVCGVPYTALPFATVSRVLLWKLHLRLVICSVFGPVVFPSLYCSYCLLGWVISFYPHNAVIVWVGPTSYGPMSFFLSVCLCLSQLGVLSKEMNGLIWFLAWKLFSTSSSLCFKEIQELFTVLRKFCHGIPIVERAANLGRERWTCRSGCDKLDCRWSAMLSSDGRPL